MRLVFSFRPQFCKLRVFFQNLRNAAAVDQPLVVKCGGGLYPFSSSAGRFFHQRKPPPLDVELVLNPLFAQTADGDVTTDLRLFWLCLRNQRRKSAAVAAAKN